jgi:hypothetical protein
MPSENKFIILTPHSVLKNLEELFLYDTESDELYELNADAYQFLLKICRGENPPIREEDEKFIQILSL